MKNIKSSRRPLQALSVTVGIAGVALLALGAWYLWFGSDAEVTEDQLREMRAFEEYERERAAG